MREDLLNILDKYFDLGELRTLCFELGVDFDNLRGEGKIDKARELIRYMERRRRLPILVSQIQAMRPGLKVRLPEKRHFFPWLRKAEIDEERARRHRPRMLDKVEKFWVQEVQAESVGETEINLDLVERRIVTRELKPRLQNRGKWSRVVRGADIGSVFDAAHQSMVVLGEAGSGKSTLLRILARDRIKRAKEYSDHPIPVVLFLSSWQSGKQTIKEWLIRELIVKYAVPKSVARTWVEYGDLLLLLDGLDEVAKVHREPCVEALNAYLEEYDQVPVVVCCRTAVFEALEIDLKLHAAVQIEPLTAAHIETYLDKIGQGGDNLKILFQQDKMLLSLAQTPLMLMTITLAYGSNSESAVLDENVTADLRQRQLFNTFTEEMFKRDLLKLFPRQQTISWLAWLAEKMVEDDSHFHLENLRPSWLDNRRQRFFFAAIVRLIPILLLFLAFALGGLLGIIFESAAGEGNTEGLAVVLAIGAVCSLIMGLASILAAIMPGKRTILLTTAVTVFLALILGSLLSTPEENLSGVFLLVGLLLGAFGGWLGNAAAPTGIHTTESLGFSWPQLLWTAPVSLVTGLFFWWLTEYSLPDGVSFGLLIGLVVGLVRGFRRSEALGNKIMPNQGIIWSGQNAFKVGIAVFLAALLPLALGGLFDQADPTNGITLGLFLAVPVSFAFWFTFGGAAVIQHAILRCILALDGCLPWRLEAFLDYTDKLILVRKVGGGYVFYHNLLQVYFAQMEE